MPDTFVHIKGILNDSCRDDAVPNIVSQKFVVRADNQENFSNQFNVAMGEIFKMQGMLVVKDEAKPSGLENIQFIPMHRIARLEFETKEIIGKYPEGGEGTKQ